MCDNNDEKNDKNGSDNLKELVDKAHLKVTRQAEKDAREEQPEGGYINQDEYLKAIRENKKRIISNT